MWPTAQHLTGAELGRLSCCSKRWLELAGNIELWRRALRLEHGGVGHELQQRAERIEAIRRAEARAKTSSGQLDDDAAAAAAATPAPAADTVAALRRRYQLGAAIAG